MSAPVTNSHALVGRALGSWELVRRIGEGTFGTVYEARHRTISGRMAALKVLHPELSFTEHNRRRFLNEANAASRANHDGVVQILDCGETDDGLCFVVMELLRGRSLKERLRAGALPAGEAREVAEQVAAALEALHGVGIVHRDLKPDNLFLVPGDDGRERLKLLDFGLAKMWDADLQTKTGMWMGTPPYMSPEQWQTLPDLDGRSDLYALGVILFECVTGQLPFRARTPFEWLTAHLGEVPPDVRTLASVPDSLATLITALLAKSRDDRPASGAEVLARLRAPAPVPASTPVSSPPQSPLPPRRTLWPAAAGIVAILAGAGLFHLSRHSTAANKDSVTPAATPSVTSPVSGIVTPEVTKESTRHVEIKAETASPVTLPITPVVTVPVRPTAPARPARRKPPTATDPAIRLVDD